MQATQKKLVVFDLDGTLNQTHLFSVPAHKEALRQFGIKDVTEAQIIGIYGARAEDYIKVLLPDADDTARREYLRLVSKLETEYILTLGAPFDGIPALLAKLKEAGFLIGVCSNASARYINHVLDSLSLAQYIDYVQPLLPDLTKVESLANLLATVQPVAAVMIGDRAFDMEAAHRNSLPFIGCLYGYNPEEVASGEGAAAHPLDIYEHVCRLIGSCR